MERLNLAECMNLCSVPLHIYGFIHLITVTQHLTGFVTLIVSDDISLSSVPCVKTQKLSK